jgi:hypothetical protein
MMLCMTLPGSGCRDITYIPVKNGFLSLVANMDWATRKVLTCGLPIRSPLDDCFAIACRATDGFKAKRIIDTWIGFYNSERPHTALDKRTPDIAYFGQAETRKAA